MRPNPDLHPNQAQNVRMIYSILGHSLERIFAEVDLIDTTLGGKGLSSLFHEVYCTVFEDPLQGWAQYYDAFEPPRLFKGLLEEAMMDAFVIIFEASPVLIRFMSRLEIPFIDIRLHPARFLCDLLFSFRASDAKLDNRLRRFGVAAEYVEAEVNTLREKNLGARAVLPEDAIIFIAQCSRDATIIHEGRFMSIMEKSDVLKQHCAERPTFIKPHPYDQNSINAKEWAKIFPTSEWLDLNLYEMFASHHNLNFVTISSSAGYEAELFGHKTLSLSPRAPKFDDMIHQLYTPLLHVYWLPEFWEWVFNLSSAPPAIDPITFTTDRLRKAIGMSWSKPI